MIKSIILDKFNKLFGFSLTVIFLLSPVIAEESNEKKIKNHVNSKFLIQRAHSPAKFIPKVKTELISGCVTTESIPYLLKKIDIIESEGDLIFKNFFDRNLVSVNYSCLHYSAVLELPEGKKSLAIMNPLYGLDNQEYMLFSKDSKDSPLKIISVRISEQYKKQRVISFSISNFNKEFYLDTDLIPSHLQWELLGIIQEMYSVFSNLDSTTIRVILDEESDSSAVSIAAIQLLENKTNRIIDTAVSMRHENGNKSYYSYQGIEYERKLFTSSVNYSRISRGVGSSITTIKRPIKFKSRVNKKVKLIFRTFKIKGVHVGIDFAASKGTEVHAVADGEIIFLGSQGGFGNLVIIKHADQYQTFYAHFSQFKSGLNSGMSVHRGDIIGYVGSTGFSTGPHLHFELRKNGEYIDPFNIENQLEFCYLHPDEHVKLLTNMLLVNFRLI